MTTSANRVHDGPARTAGAAWAARWASWVEALQSRLFPPAPVLLLRADGSRAVWLGDAPLPPEAVRKEPQFVAVEVPDELLLHRTLDLPRLSPELTADAVQLDVRSHSPFAPDDLAWGSTVRETADGARRAHIAIASRRQLSQYLATHGPEPAESAPAPEAWALAGAVPIVITGYGEPARLAQAAVRARWDVALAALALLLAALAAMTPTIQLHFRAAEAARQYEAVATRAAPLVRRRDELMAINDSLRKLDAAVADRVDPADVMEYLTRVLPDDTYLYSLDIRKAKVTAGGHTVDAAALLQKLSADPRLKDLRAPTAVTRAPGATKEAFTLEFTMAPLAPAVHAPAVSALPTAVSPPAAPVAEAAPAAAAPVAAAAPASAAPAGTASAAKASGSPAPGASPFAIGGSRK
jgi:general secretion pathway protein L